MTPSPDGTLNPRQSLWLDLLRGLSALAVLLHHYSNHIARLGHRVFPDVGQEAVMVFFVLSGFVIAMVAAGGERDFSTFAIRRFARFYAVVVPGVVLLFAAYGIATVFDPAAYAGWGNLQGWPGKLLAALTLSTDNAFVRDVYLPGGKPMWSLSYEFWYYLLFAFAVLLSRRGLGLVCALAIATFLGLPALLLLPVWALGLLAFHVFRHVPFSRGLAWTLAVGGPAALAGLQLSGVRYSFLNTRMIFGAEVGQATFFPYYYLVGLAVAAHLLGALTLLKRPGALPAPSVVAGVRRMAHSAFFLYLTHMPVMFVLKAWFGGLGLPFSIPLLAWLFALVVGPPVENLRFPLRRLLSRFAKPLNRHPGTAFTGTS